MKARALLLASVLSFTGWSTEAQAEEIRGDRADRALLYTTRNSAFFRGNANALMTSEDEGQAAAFTHGETEFKEITIRIERNRALIPALLDAADKEATVTGIADFDSLSAVFGLVGIYRVEVMSSPFYGYRFRLRFPANSKVADIADGYLNLPAIQSAKSKPVYLGHGIHSLGGSKNAAVRIPTKVAFGIPFYVAFWAISAILYDTYLYSDEDRIENSLWGGWDGVFYGLPIGAGV